MKRGAFGLVVLAVSLVVLLVPALAGAQTFTVNSTGDGAKTAVGASCQTATVGECTLRAAIQAANEDVTRDTIGFDPAVFQGEEDVISPGSLLPEIEEPLVLDGGSCDGGAMPCVGIVGISGFGTISVRADETVITHLALTGGSVGIRAIASGNVAPGVEILDNTITDTGNAIETVGTIGGTGNLIEGNEISVANGFNQGIAVVNGPNRIFGNEIEGSGCCDSGIFLHEPAAKNRVGGDDVVSENVVDNFLDGAIAVISTGHNEIGRNRGAGGSKFIIATGVVAAPAIGSALQSSVSGTAEPGAKVRVFRKATEDEGEVEGFLGEATADGAGKWEVTFSKVPIGTFVAATQTFEGGTTELSEVASTEADPTPPPEEGGGDGGENSKATVVVDPLCFSLTGCPPPPPPAPVSSPTVELTKKPQPKSAATTAKFKFTAVPAAAAKFECKLDRGKFAKCKSPKTYKRLKPGRHTFKVIAVGSTGLKSKPATYKFTVQG